MTKAHNYLQYHLQIILGLIAVKVTDFKNDKLPYVGCCPDVWLDSLN